MAIRRVPSFAIFFIIFWSWCFHMTHPPYRTRTRRFAVCGLSYKSEYLFHISATVKFVKRVITSCRCLELQSNNDAVYRTKPCSDTKLYIKVLKISISLAYLHAQERMSCVVITEN